MTPPGAPQCQHPAAGRTAQTSLALRRRQITSTDCKMARFFSSIASKAAGMRKALFTNGPGIGTLASAGVGCVALQMNFGTHARRALTQSRTEPKKCETTFSYDGWQMDAEFAEERDIEYPDNPEAMGAILDTMLRKQQVHNGDRSHPIIRKLDAVTPTLSYAGWEIDARKIEWPEAKSPESQYERTQLRFIVLSRIGGGVGMRERDVDFALERMRTKQIQHEIATESSDAKQRRLNDIVNRGLERQKINAPVHDWWHW